MEEEHLLKQVIFTVYTPASDKSYSCREEHFLLLPHAATKPDAVTEPKDKTYFQNSGSPELYRVTSQDTTALKRRRACDAVSQAVTRGLMRVNRVSSSRLRR